MFKAAIEKINKANNIYITGHINPDGDSVGACFALYNALKSIGKNPYVIMPEVACQFEYFDEVKERIVDIDGDNMELYICVDCADIDRTSIDNKYVKTAKDSILIDHHRTNNGFAKTNIIIGNAGSTCEIIYNLLNEMNIEITKDIAKYIYIGIIMDTRSLTTPNTTKDTFDIVGKLVETGIDFPDIYRNIINTMKYGKLKLLAKTIDNMEEYLDNKVLYSKVEYEYINSQNLNDEDSEGMTNYGQMVEGVEASIYVRGKKNGTYKVSMRSNGKVDLSIIAAEFRWWWTS